ncbi:MAG: hypothetical protein KIS78_16395 [Labilithrix sp.]|nr:hypothetical protein [Labilithrix sp.]MCW5833981.1 hypothetical protein [Labilithrix sp.]
MRFSALAAPLVVAGLFACTHTVEGEGRDPAASSGVWALPVAGETCRCTSAVGERPPESCCDGGLVCGDPATGAPSRTLCDSMGCWRSGVCLEGTSSSEVPSSSGGSSGSLPDFPEPPPDECSPFKRDNDTCPPGKECHLVRDHWGCV